MDNKKKRDAKKESKKGKAVKNKGSSGDTVVLNVSKNETFGNNNVGKWEADEVKKFFQGTEMYGKDWKKIASFIGTRDAM